MKIDKRNPRHWLYLGLFAVNVGIAIALRPFIKKPHRTKITLYGHKLSGNLLALYKELRNHNEFEVFFLTLDPNYYNELRRKGESCLLATSWSCIPWLASSGAVISDHGLHSLVGMLLLTDVKFFDVWHAIPFKGFDSEDFEVQRKYDEVWVASSSLAKIYKEKYGFDESKIAVTGYARTDRLIRDANLLRARALHQIGLPNLTGKVVLFAPTWKQDSQSREIFPFGLDETEFYNALSKLAGRFDATFIVRTHLNSQVGAGLASACYTGVIALPYATMPDTEAILLATDILICDWSSIAFDFLLMSRPTVFLDVPAPFRKGYSLGPEYRFGAIVRDMDQFLATMARYLMDPRVYYLEFGARAAQIREEVYGSFADGEATMRCLQQLKHAFSK